MNNEVGTAEVEWLLTLAELPDMESMESLEGGWDNSNFLLRLKGGSEVVLKAWFANSVEEVGRVVQRHIHLDANDIPTTVPLQLSNGGHFAERNGVAWTILPFVPGGMLGSDEDSLRSLGEVLGRMSSIPPADCFPENYRMGFELFEEVISLSSKMGLSNPFVDMLTSEIDEIRRDFPSDLPIGILHGDLFPDNVIGSGGQVSAILDLEESWIGPMAFDLAMACVGFGWDGTVPAWERWKDLFDGYQSIRRLTQEEVDSLPFLHRFATLSIAAWRFWKHSLSAPDELLSSRYLEMVDRLSVEIDFSEVVG
ncbi:MAG: phosphotransferase [Candidatus Thalassarchaeaceae archaeon]